MALNINEMKATELVRLLNSTPLGFVINDREIYRQRDRAGFRISADSEHKTISLIKYLAWLVDVRHGPQPIRQNLDYEEVKNAARARNARLSAQGRDIGMIPEVIDPERKQFCEENFQAFCEYYFPETFNMPWSNDHLKVIARIEQAVLHGGLFAMAMPRGTGKSSLAETACLWAMLYGHREFVVLVGATETAALETLGSIKTELEGNELLLEDFPEVVYPIQCLNGISNRCKGQLCNGERTRISWTANEIVLPTIEDSRAAGAIIRVAGITGRIRGMKFKRPDKARPVRPSLVIIDDPQTTESANSYEQTRKRVRVLAGDILGLAGPGQKISGILPCTVIHPGDMADQILNRQKHPDWNGERTKMVYKFPDNEKLWEKYAELRSESLRQYGDLREATKFYKEHQDELDEGAEVAWEVRFNHDEISAIQHAMNLKLQDEAAFWSEYQNEPLPEYESEDEMLKAEEIRRKLNGVPSGEIPTECGHLTMHIDVQKKLLFYVVTAWTDSFSGSVIDYGTYPEQHRRIFTLRDARPSLQDIMPTLSFEAALYKALDLLVNKFCGKEWTRMDGAKLKIGRCLIDANWGISTDVIYQFCRQSQYSGILLPSHGRYVGASSISFAGIKRRPGDRKGLNWYMRKGEKRSIRHVAYDANFWKSFVHSRLKVPIGDQGCLTLFGNKPAFHRKFSEHLTAEYFVKTQGRGRKVDEWKLRPEASDNHWFDCLTGSAVGASILGVTLPEIGQVGSRRKREQICLSELQKQRWAEKARDGLL
jgi:hypothetical protein